MVRVFIAAVEGSPFLYGAYPYELISYYYRSVLGKEFWEKATQLKCLMVDSGAHTFFTQAGVRRGASNRQKSPDPFDYVHDYCAWLTRHRNQIGTHVELDIDSLVGWEKQCQLRDVFETYNLDPVWVWHECNKLSFEETCQKRNYVGISSFEELKGNKSLPDKQIRKMLAIADKYGTKVHIFGHSRFSDFEGLSYYKSFFSVDSSTMVLSGSKYAMACVWDESRKDMHTLSKHDWARKFGTPECTEFTDLSYNDRVIWNYYQFMKGVPFWESLNKEGEKQRRLDGFDGAMDS